MVVRLSGMMTGAAAAPPGVSDCALFIALVDPGVLTEPADYRRRIATFADSIRAARPVEGGSTVRVSFDRSVACREETLRRGTIDVPEAVVTALCRGAEFLASAPSSRPAPDPMQKAEGHLMNVVVGGSDKDLRREATRPASDVIHRC
ncbi:hypothetical protein N599_21785 [Saccharopolyspora erythraea D]|nr:hypothetical protein N599_21785 [Saccharopolyspora erythraea D]